MHSVHAMWPKTVIRASTRPVNSPTSTALIVYIPNYYSMEIVYI